MRADDALLERLARTLEGMGLQPARDEPLWRHTSFRIGGPADLWVAVPDATRLAEVVAAAQDLEVPATVLGGGTNVLVSDRGIRGLVTRFRAPVGRPEAVSEGRYRVSCGAPLAGLARWAVRQGLAGLEWAVGIPGTVGGAVLGNAGAYGGCMADVLERVEVWERGQHRWVERDDLAMGYRTTAWKASPTRPVLLTAEVRLAPAAPDVLKGKAEAYQEARQVRQPKEPSAGSVFRNPAEAPAGRLIEEAGLKGFRIGDAMVSPVHANYIVNVGSASAQDVWALMQHIQDVVLARFGIHLEPEIERLGEWT
ncbi:MAG: UDP-N-acetylmuramate dehydrogenase [Anaerolineae bacterium]|nr:UDP-N-acetylmuramate dehydrogenase [Anaerolineae bacterium]